MKRQVFAFCLIVLLAGSARADFLVRIGDIDGFGFNLAPGFRAANGGAANRDGVGVLGEGDFLPDINRNGNLQRGGGDDFDLRSGAEITNTAYSVGEGVTTAVGTTGSKFTDISLSTSYDASSAANRVLIGGNPIDGLDFGKGGAFPSPPSSSLPNQPGFVFRFEVNKAALDPSSSIFFNLVFGDFDVVPARIRITSADQTTQNIGLERQNNAVADGLIQEATATLTFGSVFTDGGSVWRGALNVDFLAPNEPFTAFDYVELSTKPLVQSVPEPSGLVLLGVGIAVAIGYARRR